jgi:antitoxin component YwqK of YwqJK toxin-antitoxin module
MVIPLNPHRLLLIIGLIVSTPALPGVLQAEDIDIDSAPPAFVPEPDELEMFADQSELDADAQHSSLAASGSPIEIVNERYPSGNVKIRREVTRDRQWNYILHGEWKMWDERGNLIGFGQYRDNVRHGAWTRIYLAGEAEMFSQMPYKEYEAPFTSQATFKDGKLHGQWIISDAKQRKISEWEYDNGLRHGVRKWTYASGQPMKEATYHQGLLDGRLRVWDADSQLIVDEVYQQGQKLALKVEYDDDGKKRSEGMYLHARYVIETPADWWNARPCVYRTTGEDVKHGRYTTWFPNGQRSQEGAYVVDVPDGQFTWWYPNSQERMSGSYKNGKSHGPWVWWHENGQRAAQGTYVYGTPSGVWASWEDNGRLSRKSDFSEDGGSVAVHPETTEEAFAPQTETSRRVGTERTAR